MTQLINGFFLENSPGYTGSVKNTMHGQSWMVGTFLAHDRQTKKHTYGHCDLTQRAKRQVELKSNTTSTQTIGVAYTNFSGSCLLQELTACMMVWPDGKSDISYMDHIYQVLHTIYTRYCIQYIPCTAHNIYQVLHMIYTRYWTQYIPGTTHHIYQVLQTIYTRYCTQYIPGTAHNIYQVLYPIQTRYCTQLKKTGTAYNICQILCRRYTRYEQNIDQGPDISCTANNIHQVLHTKYIWYWTKYI